VREVILAHHGRGKPTFLITNDFDMPVRDIVPKYARRWLVEQEIAEQIMFFQPNHPSSSIVVKVDFDLTLSLLAHNLYRVVAKQLSGFEQCTVDTIHRKFLENGARISIEGNSVTVYLKKKTHLPILFELPWMKKTTRLILDESEYSVRIRHGVVDFTIEHAMVERYFNYRNENP
jgi:hypothetical protein